MHSTLFPVPLVMCNWASFKGQKDIFNFRITYAMKSKFIKRFGDRFITMAINSMMNFYGNNPDQFKTDIDNFYKIMNNPSNIIEEIAQKTINECVTTDDYDYTNSKQIIIQTAKQVFDKFKIVVSTIHNFDIENISFEKNWLFNFLLFMAMDRLKVVEVSGNPL